MTMIEWLKRVFIDDEHPLPEHIRTQQHEHVETLHKAVVAVEGLDKHHGEVSRALTELRELESTARKQDE